MHTTYVQMKVPMPPALFGTLVLRQKCGIKKTLKNTRKMYDIVGWAWAAVHAGHRAVACIWSSS